MEYRDFWKLKRGDKVKGYNGETFTITSRKVIPEIVGAVCGKNYTKFIKSSSGRKVCQLTLSDSSGRTRYADSSCKAQWFDWSKK